MRSDLVLTPGGYRHRSLVHRLEPNQAVQIVDGRARLLHQTTRAITELPIVTLQPGDVPGFGTGWITYGTWTNTTGTPISSFATRWRVPPPPKTQSSQTIFLFNGIDPANPSDAILQPVLQWGPSHAGGGSYWAVASWYVLGSGPAFYTNLVPVNPGDEVVGVMTLTAQAAGKFSYTAEFQGIAGTSLPVQSVNELVWCNETLEAYGISACSDYPDTDLTPMRGITLKTGTTIPGVNWTPVDQVIDCGQHALVPVNSGDGGEVDLYYRQPTAQFNWGNLAQFVQILFGVTNDGGGVVILPNGRIIRIPPRSPEIALFRQIAEGLAEVGRGFAISEDVSGSADRMLANSLGTASLQLMAGGLKGASEAVMKALSVSTQR